MPAQYEAIKESIRKKNPKMSEKDVKMHAAKIYNSLHPDKPLIRWTQEEKKRKNKK